MEKKKAPKVPKETPWKSFSNTDKKAIHEFSHFTSKVINSNTAPFGIRLSSEDKIDLPYVAVRTMDPNMVPVDYFHGGQTMKAFRQFSWAKRKASGAEGKDLFSGATPEDLEYIDKALEEMSKRFESKSSFVGLRLRQIIVQNEKGEDIALTPVPSPGFSEILRSRLEEERSLHGKAEGRDKGEVMYDRRRGFVGIGGANTQNVGGYVSSMQSPLFFSPPKEDKGIRAFYAVVASRSAEGYKRYFRLSSAILLEFYKWRENLLNAHRGIMPGDLDTREAERGFIARLIMDLEERSLKALRVVGGMDEEKYADDIDRLMKDPWLNPSIRDNDWVKTEADRIHREILHARFFNGKDFGTIGVGEKDSLRWIEFIREELQ